jgi:hypothetical protein
MGLIMEKEILQIINSNNNLPKIGSKIIANHIFHFIDFLRDSAYGDGNGRWCLRTTGENDLLMTSEEIYEFWVKNVK